MRKFFRLDEDRDIDVDTVQQVHDYSFEQFDYGVIKGKEIPVPLPASLRIWVTRGKKHDVLLNPLSWLIVSTRFLGLIEKYAYGPLQAVELPLTLVDGRGLVRGYWAVNSLKRIAAAPERDWNQQLDPRKVPEGVHLFQAAELFSVFVVDDVFLAACKEKGIQGIDCSRIELVESKRKPAKTVRAMTSAPPAAIRTRHPLERNRKPAPPLPPDVGWQFNELIAKRRLQPCIKLLEKALNDVKRTPYHALVGRNFLHQTEELAAALIEFCNECAESRLKLAAVYWEMNGFSINPKQWHCDLFGFKRVGKGLDWLSDPDEVGDTVVLSGMEPVQKAFAQIFTKDKQSAAENLAGEIATYLVTARFMQVAAAATKLAQRKDPRVKRLLVLATAHDYDTMWRSR